MKLLRKRGRGFSLLELMIVLGVAAVIAMFALPSYRAHVERGHRLEAMAALMRAVQFVESARFAPMPASGNVIALEAGQDQAPSNGTAIYRLAVLPESATNGGYAIEAAPVIPGAMQDDACGTFIVEATGVRANRASAPLDAARSSLCWAGKG